MKNYDLVIVGSGPAGLSAAIYAARAALDFVVLESAPVSGGQVLTTSDVDNYPGLPTISGWELSEKMRKHADKLGAVFEIRKVVELEDKGITKRLKCDDGQVYEARAVLIATGSGARKLMVPGEDRLKGAGVSYCATCDGNFFRGRTVAVVGGGDTAMEDALYLSKLCEKVYLIHRRDVFRGARTFVDKIQQISNIQCIMNANVKEIRGEQKVESVLLDIGGEEQEMCLDGVFVAIGVKPASELLEGIVQMDNASYVLAGENCVTTCTGVFVAGDIRKKPLRQIVTAVADGSNAIYSIVDYLK